jgi:type II secretory pathway component PulF
LREIMYFEYQAMDRTGKKVRGQIRAADHAEAETKILSRGMSPLSIVKSADTDRSDMEKPESDIVGIVSVRTGKLSKSELINFSRQWATVMRSGIPILQGLQTLQEQTSSTRARALVKAVADNIKAGGTLHQSLELFPETFTPYYRGMILAAERGGKLDVMLTRIADDLEIRRKFRMRTITAMILPGFFLIISLLFAFIAGFYILPQYVNIYYELGGELPRTSQMVFSAVQNCGQILGWLLGIIAAILIVLILIRRTEEGALFVDRQKLRILLFGTIYRKWLMERFVSTWGALVKSGVPVTEGLRLAAGTADNAHVNKQVDNVIDDIEDGAGLSESFSRQIDWIPVHMKEMISIGETSGKLDEVLENLSINSRLEAEEFTKRTIIILSLLSLFAVLAFIGFLVIAVAMAYYGLFNYI